MVAVLPNAFINMESSPSETLPKKDRNWVKANFGVNLEKSWLELHGTNCIELNHVGRNIQDSISETRTFPTDINDFDYLRARIAIYAADCAKSYGR